MLIDLGTTWNEGLELGLRTQPLRVRLPNQVQVKGLQFEAASSSWVESYGWFREQLVRFLTANKDKNFVKSHGREPDKFIKKQGEFSLKDSFCGSDLCWAGSVFFLSKAARDVYPGSWLLTIPDPGSNKNKKRRGKKFVVLPFLVTINFTKSNFFVFLTGTATCQRIKVLFLPKKLLLSSQKYELEIRDPGSEIWDPVSEIRDPEKIHITVRIQWQNITWSRSTTLIQSEQEFLAGILFCTGLLDSDPTWQFDLSILL